jgi:hypothetical protein
MGVELSRRFLSAMTDPLVAENPLVDVSIVMPCLNEVDCIAACIANAEDTLRGLAEQYGLGGEIVIADNGSTDGSQALASALGVRVVAIAARGYGAAMIGGGHAARGQYIVFGDADGSYDFREAVPMIGELLNGADLCMGSRFLGGIEKGAMPWKNRYIGNPVLTGIANLIYRTGISDAHCGLRAVTTETFNALCLSGSGMEFASEMVIKAAMQRRKIVEVPATLSRDLRTRAPHLRPWRDGWRHLRYLFMLSPTAMFILPGVIAATLSLTIFAMAMLHALVPQLGSQWGMFGNYWQVAASSMGAIGHQAVILGLAAQLYGLREGYRPAGSHSKWLARYVSLETMLASGLILVLAGGAVLAGTIWSWTLRDLGPTYSVLPPVGGTLLIVLGAQTIFGGFLLSVIGGNEARFFAPKTALSTEPLA